MYEIYGSPSLCFLEIFDDNGKSGGFIDTKPLSIKSNKLR